MKFLQKSLVLLSLVILCGVMDYSSCRAQSVTTTTSITTTTITSINGLSTIADSLKFQNSLDYVAVGGNSGTARLDGSLPVLTYTSNSVEWVELDIYTDFATAVGLKADVDLVPVNNFITSKLGKNGSISLPILNTLVSNYISIKLGVGEGYNWNQKKPETIISLVLLQTSF